MFTGGVVSKDTNEVLDNTDSEEGMYGVCLGMIIPFLQHAAARLRGIPSVQISIAYAAVAHEVNDKNVAG